MDKLNKIKIQLDRDIAEKIARKKNLGESYSDVLRRLLKVK